jgi:hypothetical protein
LHYDDKRPSAPIDGAVAVYLAGSKADSKTREAAHAAVAKAAVAALR